MPTLSLCSDSFMQAFHFAFSLVGAGVPCFGHFAFPLLYYLVNVWGRIAWTLNQRLARILLARLNVVAYNLHGQLRPSSIVFPEC